MSGRALGIAGLLVLLLLAGWWLLGEAGAPDPAPAKPTAHGGEAAADGAAQDAAQDAIVLQGSSLSREGEPQPAVPAPAAPLEPEPASNDGAAAEDGDARLAALIAAIRAEIEPEYWESDPVAALESRNGILIARAPRDVLDQVQEYLESLRRKRLAAAGIEFAGKAIVEGEVGATQVVDPAVAARAVAELRVVLQGMLRQAVTLDRVLAALRAGSVGDAKSLTSDALAVEPDHALAVTLLSLLEKQDGSQRADGTSDVGPLLESYAAYLSSPLVLATGPLRDWFERWPSRTTAERARTLWREAGRPTLGLRSVEREEVLERGSVSLHVEDGTLPAALRDLQIRTFVDLEVDPRVLRDLGEHRIQGLSIEARPLSIVLERILGHLPEGYAWRVSSRTIQFLRAGDMPPALIRYFDVKDLRGDEVVAPTPADLVPPTYSSPSAPPRPPPVPPTVVPIDGD